MDLKLLEQEFKDYEIGFVTVDEAVAQEISALLVNSKVEILTTGPVKQITLSYPIKKHQTAFFGYFHFKTVSETIKKIQEELSLKTNILRFLILTPPMKKVVERVRPVFSDKPVNHPSEINDKNLSEKNELKPMPEILSNELLEQKLEEILQ